MDSFKVNSERYVLLRLIMLSAAPSINGKRRINCEMEAPAQAQGDLLPDFPHLVFTARQFARLYMEGLAIEDELMSKFWAEHFFNPGTGLWNTRLRGGDELEVSRPWF